MQQEVRKRRRKTRSKTNKRKPKLLAPIMIFLVGAGIFLYPFISNQVVLSMQSKEIHTYESKVDSIAQEKLDEMLQAATVYNDNLTGDPLHDPFILGSGYVLPDNYLDVLNISDNGIMCYLEIPKIKVNMPIYHGTSDWVLQRGAGHIEGTALPIGGNYRHSIVCAHRGLPSAELFSRLDELEVGDLFYIHIFHEIHAYEVDQIETILPEDINEHMEMNREKDFITLMTCTPYGVNTHRLLVRGSRTEYIPEEKEVLEQPELQSTTLFFFTGTAVGSLLLIILTVYLRKRRRTRHG